MSKLFCIIEQGKHVNHDITKFKKKLFNTDDCDFYRFNWKEFEDPLANWTRKDTADPNKILSWGEGRNLMYDKVPKDYEYYIMIDEDIILRPYPDDKFETHIPSYWEGKARIELELDPRIVERITSFLKEWNPLGGHILAKQNWGFDEKILSEMKVMDRPVTCRRHDVCTSILHKSFADLMFPIQYNGQILPQVYQQWFAKTCWPNKYMVVPGLYSINFLSEPHHNIGLADEQYKNNFIIKPFNNCIKENAEPYVNYLKDKSVKNSEIPMRDKVIPTIDDISKVYDIDKDNFKNSRKYL
jgi:hypothetical protein|tara:strand:- start:2072 stop:2968 length:897 start_codon:yes stop_codon:yes gene_type:complete